MRSGLGMGDDLGIRGDFPQRGGSDGARASCSRAIYPPPLAESRMPRSDPKPPTSCGVTDDSPGCASKVASMAGARIDRHRASVRRQALAGMGASECDLLPGFMVDNAWGLRGCTARWTVRQTRSGSRGGGTHRCDLTAPSRCRTVSQPDQVLGNPAVPPSIEQPQINGFMPMSSSHAFTGSPWPASLRGIDLAIAFSSHSVEPENPTIAGEERLPARPQKPQATSGVASPPSLAQPPADETGQGKRERATSSQRIYCGWVSLVNFLLKIIFVRWPDFKRASSTHA